jgi:hypothetical protein
MEEVQYIFIIWNVACSFLTYSLIGIIISMTKLLDADWLRGVHNYLISCSAVQLMIFPKQTKWRKGILNTNVK